MDGSTQFCIRRERKQFLGPFLREAEKQIYSAKNLGLQLQGERQRVDILRGFYFSSAYSIAHSTQLPLNNSYLSSLFGPIPDSSTLWFIDIS